MKLRVQSWPGQTPSHCQLCGTSMEELQPRGWLEVTIISGNHQNLWCILYPLDNLKWMFLRTLTAKISCFSILLNHSSAHKRRSRGAFSSRGMSSVCQEGYRELSLPLSGRANRLAPVLFCQQLQLLGTSVSPRSSWHSPQQRTRVCEWINTHMYVQGHYFTEAAGHGENPVNFSAFLLRLFGL